MCPDLATNPVLPKSWGGLSLTIGVSTVTTKGILYGMLGHIKWNLEFTFTR